MDLKIFADDDNFVAEGLALVRQVMESKSDTVRIALSGGGTPQSLYYEISQTDDLPFERVEFFQTDERWTAPDHPDSNRRMIMEHLVSPIEGRLSDFHGFETILRKDEALLKYEHELVKLPEPFDLTILGIGPDGHVASLFPFSDALKEEKRLVAETTTNEFKIRERVTVTFPVLMKSRALLVLLKGPTKKHILDVLDGHKKEIPAFPAIKLLEHPNLTVHFCEI